MDPERRGYTPPYGISGEPKSADIAGTVLTAMILLAILVVVAVL